MEPGHLLHSALTRPLSANAQRLKSRHPYMPTAQQQWADLQWSTEWADNPTRLCIFILNFATHTLGITLPRTACVRLNCLCTSVRCFHSSQGSTPTVKDCIDINLEVQSRLIARGTKQANCWRLLNIFLEEN